MSNNIFGRIQNGIREKRNSLSNWLSTASEEEKNIRLGMAGDLDLQAHLQVMESTLVKTEDQTLGVCVVCHEKVDDSVLETDYTACVCLDHFTDMQRRQLETDLELSQMIQHALFSQDLPDIPGIDLAAFSQAAQILGGDIYAFPRYRDEMYGVAIADAMGHGVSASLLMTSLQTSLRTLVPENLSPVNVLNKINRLFLHNVHFTTFVTAFLGRFDPRQRRFTYCNAGHNPPLLFRAKTAEVQWLKPTGASLGLVENFQIEPVSFTLRTGDILLLYTDGVVEAMNSQLEQFGYERLSQFVFQGADLSAQELVQSLRLAVVDFMEGQPLADDVTIVAFKSIAR